MCILSIQPLYVHTYNTTHTLGILVTVDTKRERESILYFEYFGHSLVRGYEERERACEGSKINLCSWWQSCQNDGSVHDLT